MSSKLKKIYGLAAIVMLAIFVAACGGGGGGGGGSTPPPVTAKGTLTSNASCTVPEGESFCNISVSWTTTNASSPRVTVNGVSVSTLANSGATPGSFSISLGTTTIAVLDGSTVLASTEVKAICGTSSDVVAGLCKSWWPPAWPPAPIGTKVIGATVQILPTALLIGDASWQTDVKNRVVEFVDTGMVLTGYSTKPLVFAYYKSLDGTYCTRPVFKDTGFGVAPGGPSYTYGACTTEPLTWVVGTKNGIIRYAAQRDECFELVWKWNPTLNGFDLTSTETSCPF